MIKKILFPLVLIPLFFSVLAFNIQSVLYNCIHAIDFSIYQQAIYDIASGTSLNPHITIRGISIFLDHFDPVLIFSVPMVWIFGAHPVPLLVFEYFWFIGAAFFLYKKLPYKLFQVALIWLIFCKCILNGLAYPIHPTTWTILPAIMLAYFISKKMITRPSFVLFF